MLYFFHVALFPCCTFSMLHFFHIALFPCCTFQCWTFSILHFFHVAFFSFCTFSMLHFFHVAFMLHSFLFPCSLFSCWTWLLLKNIEMNERQKTQSKSNLTLSTVNLFHFYFDILSNVFCHYIVLNGWKSEKEPIYYFVGKEYVSQALKLLRLGCEFLPEIKYLADILIVILRMNRLRKNILVLKKKTHVVVNLF